MRMARDIRIALFILEYFEVVTFLELEYFSIKGF